MGSDNKPKTEAEPKKINIFTVLIPCLIFLAIGTVLAAAIFNFDGNKDKYEEKIAAAAAEDLHWLFLGIVVFGRMVVYTNFYSMGFKSEMKGNVRANPFYYRTDGGDSIVLESEGDLGRFNRANRSVQHMVENFGSFLVGMVLAGNIFPKAVFFLVCIYSLGRVLHQSGYTGGYGGHAVGFVLANIIAGQTMDGLCLIVYLKGSGTM